MSFSGAVTQIETHAKAAATAVDSTFTDVQVAHPVPKGRSGRIFYIGDSESERAGAARTLTTEMRAERVMVIYFWPLSTSGEDFANNIETQVIAVNQEVKTRLLGDSTLGGACNDLELGDTVTDFVQVGGGTYRTLEIEVMPTFLDAYPIAS
jgi:hypothetical protein